ncbi:peptide chain release factor 2, partial [Campylobacter jejuni]
MDNYEFSELLKTLKNKVGNIASIIKPENIKTRLKEIEELENSPSFWSDVKQAGIIGKEKTKITNLLKNYENAFNALNDASELFDLANSENDTETLEALFN